MGEVKNHPLFEKLVSLKLPNKDYTVFGSGPLYANGLIKDIGDIDVVAKGKAWKMAKSLGDEKETPSKMGRGVSLFGGEIEIYNEWSPGDWDISKLIEESDIIEGIRFVNLETVLKWKKMLGRKKDKKHIKKIEKHLNRRGTHAI